MSWTNFLNPDQKVSRRQFLAAGTAAGILGTSGCLTSESGRTTEEEGTGTSEESKTEQGPDTYAVSELGEKIDPIEGRC